MEKAPKIIVFTDIKQDLLNVLNQKISTSAIKFSEKVNIIDGFLNQPLTFEISPSFVIGGPSIPMIILAGETTGQIHFFALKALLPKLFD